MDDLHHDSKDAETATIPIETPMDASGDQDAGNASEDAATTPASAEESNDAPQQPDVQAVGEAVDQPGDQSDADVPAPDVTRAQDGTVNTDTTAAVASTADEAAGAAAAAAEADAGDAGQTDELPAMDGIVGKAAADYSTIRELGRDPWGRILLAWRSDAPPGDDQEPPVVLLERLALDVEVAQQVVDLHLYHARLLAPRALVQRPDSVHWLVVEAPATYDAAFVSVADGGRLEERSVLKAGVGLANALSYLHTNSVVHGNVGPDSMLVHDGRAYLTGVERAVAADSGEIESALQFSAEVNALAKALRQLAGLPDAPGTDESAPAQALRAIEDRGKAGGFATAEDLAQECGQALQEPTLTLPAAEDATGRALKFECGTATTVGLLRTQNQDALGCTVLQIRDDVVRDMPLGIFLVADGMGGEAAGEVASRIGARIAMAELVRQLLVPTVAMAALDPLSPEHTTGSTSVATLAQALAIAVDAANRQVRALAAALQESTGTTLTVIVAAGGRAVLAHLGDSRAYLLRDGALVQLTKDHSLLARLEELDHPLLNDPSFGMPRNYLYRSLGQEDEAPPDMMEFPVVPGDRMMLCSDGLWDELDDATIQRCLTSTDDPAECANHLVRLANAAGGHDNSTAVVVFVEAQHEDPANEISPEEADAILRSSGALDDDAGSDSLDDTGVMDDAFDMGQG